jgi:peptide-methionine (S)-S-oxide reductase
MDVSVGARVASGLWRSVGAGIIVAGIVAVVGGVVRGGSAVEVPRVLPAPVVDEQPGPSTSETAVFAGGCFWGVQGVFQHVNGVSNAVSGYAGGTPSSAHYEIVSGGRTGHAESVAVTYDPRRISYGRLLQVFFSIAHDPTQLNRQGPDVGSQYRSAVFPMSDEQARIAQAYIAQLTDARVFRAPIVTAIERARTFYAAEAYHQDYLARHPDEPYVVVNDLPKVRNLERTFPELYRAAPLLVARTHLNGR